MKELKNKFLGTATSLALLIGPAFTASAQVVSLNWSPCTNFPATLSAGAASVSPNIYLLGKNSGLALQVPINSAPGNTAAFSVWGSFSVDNGTNFGTTPFVLTGNANGTNRVVLQTNWNSMQLAGFTHVNLYLETNGPTAAITNAGVGFNRVYYNY